MPDVQVLGLRNGELCQVLDAHAVEHLCLPHAALCRHGRCVGALGHVVDHAVLGKCLELCLKVIHALEQVRKAVVHIAYELFECRYTASQVVVIGIVRKLQVMGVQPPNLFLRRAHVLKRLVLKS